MNRRAPLQSEPDFQTGVIELAPLRRWATYHTHDSRRSTAGFPDLVCVPDRVVFVELKSEVGKPTLAQLQWLSRLRAAGAEAHLFRPTDSDEIQETLR
jgi:hypothetical protein